MTKLNPCPNCGNEPDIVTNPVASYVHCSSCDHGLSVKSKTANGAMNAWNAATGDSPTKTLRDEFAMAAVAGLQPVYWETLEEYESGKHLIECMAESAYEIADRMLKERNK